LDEGLGEAAQLPGLLRKDVGYQPLEALEQIAPDTETLTEKELQRELGLALNEAPKRARAARWW
jgi:hypothetical protein